MGHGSDLEGSNMTTYITHIPPQTLSHLLSGRLACCPSPTTMTSFLGDMFERGGCRVLRFILQWIVWGAVYTLYTGHTL